MIQLVLDTSKIIDDVIMKTVIGRNTCQDGSLISGLEHLEGASHLLQEAIEQIKKQIKNKH